MSEEMRTRPPWDLVWMTVAQVMAERSLCDRDQVGAVIASETNRVVATAYNNPPAGFDHQGKNCTAWCSRSRHGAGDNSYFDCPSLHAEANALSVCDRSQREGGTMYVTTLPCMDCAKLIANSGLKRVVYEDTPTGRDREQRTDQSPIGFLRDCGITAVQW